MALSLWQRISTLLVPVKYLLPPEEKGKNGPAGKEKLHSLGKTETMVKQVLHSIPQAVFWKDRESVYLGCNEAFARSVGLKRPGDIVGKTDFDLPGLREEAENYRADDREVIGNALPKRHIIEPLQLADGRQIRVDTTKVPLFDSEGRVSGVLGIYEDITTKLMTEDALRESEEQYRQVIQSSPMGIHMYELQENDRLVFTGANPAADRILGVDNSAFIGLTIEEAFPPLADTEIPSRYRRAASEGIPWHQEEVTYEGGFIRGAFEVFAFQSGRNRVTVKFLDVTKRKQIEQERENARMFLDAALEQSPVGILIADAPHLTIRSANSAALDILGVSMQNLSELDINRDPSALRTFRPNGDPYPVNELPLPRAVLHGEITRNEELLYRNNQGKERWGLANAAPVRNRKGDIIAGMVIFQDITALKEAEKALRESEKKFKELAELLPETVYECDISGKILFANQIAFKRFGYSPEDMARGVNVLDTLAPQDRERATEGIKKIFQGEPVGPTEYLAQKPDGSTFPVLIYSSPVMDQGRVAGLRGIIVDLTEIKKVEQEQLHLERRIQQTQKLESLGVLAGGIAHDFNNILTSILGNASLGLEELAPGFPGREYLEEIERSARRAADLCRQMLAYSGKGRFVIELLNLNALIDGLSHLLNTSISKKATLIIQPDKGIPTISGDATQIQQIIMNLAINASESLNDSPGYITISTGTITCSREDLEKCWYHDAEPKPGLFVLLSVADTGCGMDETTAQRIFEPFFTTKFPGRGLGLSAILGIVRAHGGALHLETQPGKGTIFRVLFPAAKDQEPMVRTQKESADEWKGQGCILLVDDEETVRTMGKKMLEHLGFEVITASDGIEALEIFSRDTAPFALVLLDLTMPGMSGRETFKEMLQLDPSVKVIVTSGYSESDVVSRFREGKQVAFIQKPFSIKELRRILREKLETV